MEPVSIALGIPGFIAVALQTYSSVVRSINSYRNLPREVEQIIIAITREETLFAGHVHLLLATYMAERDRTELVQTRGSAPEYSQLHSKKCSWEGRFHELERELTVQRKVQDQDGMEVDVDPDEFRTILFEMDLIKDVGITLEAIKDIRSKYLKLQENEVVEASKPRDGPMEAVDLALRKLSSALKGSRKRKPVGARSAKSIPNKSSLLFHDVPSKLREELKRLEDQNRRLSESLSQRATWNNLRIAPPRSVLPSALGGTTDPPGQGSDTPLPARCTARAFLNKLYNELSEHCVCCEKHDLYLCLHIQPGKGTIVTDGDAGSQVDFDHVPTVRFTALVTTKLSAAVTVATRETGLKCLEIANSNDHLVLLEIRDVPTDHEAPRCPQNLCEEIFSNPACQGAYFLNTFHLRLFPEHNPPTTQHRRLPASYSRSPNPKSAAFDSSVITLRQLVLPESGSPWYRCDPYGLLLIAAGLVDAVPSFHSSPWARSWSTRSITYFRNLEISDDIETWKPYIAGSFSGNDSLPCSTILRALSILLAEVAGVDMDMGIGEDLDHDPVPGKMRNISRGLGKKYGDLVKRLYKAYQTSLWEDDVSVDGNIDNLCLEIAQELYAMANNF